ncbi:MAG: hypothetical protein ACFWUA_02970 [Sporanaerobacter sp.]|jgi:hypothetical protein
MLIKLWLIVIKYIGTGFLFYIVYPHGFSKRYGILGQMSFMQTISSGILKRR